MLLAGTANPILKVEELTVSDPVMSSCEFERVIVFEPAVTFPMTSTVELTSVDTAGKSGFMYTWFWLLQSWLHSKAPTPAPPVVVVVDITPIVELDDVLAATDVLADVSADIISDDVPVEVEEDAEAVEEELTALVLEDAERVEVELDDPKVLLEVAFVEEDEM